MCTFWETLKSSLCYRSGIEALQQTQILLELKKINCNLLFEVFIFLLVTANMSMGTDILAMVVRRYIRSADAVVQTG